MKNLSCLLASTCLAITVNICAQELPQSPEATVWIPRVVSDGTEQPAPKPAPDLSHHVIKRSIVNQRPDRTVTFREIERPTQQAQPVAVEPATAVTPLSNEQLEALRANAKPAQFVAVGAGIYEDGNREISRIHWWHDGEQYIAVSNFSWLHLTGFAAYETEDTQYSLLLVASETSPPIGDDLVADLPRLNTAGPKMKIIQGDPDNEEALKPIIALHDLYAEEGNMLKKAYKSRKREARKKQREQEAEKRRSGGKKKDLTLRFWKGEDRPMQNR